MFLKEEEVCLLLYTLTIHLSLQLLSTKKMYDFEVYRDNELRRKDAWPDGEVYICHGQPRCILKAHELVDECNICLLIKANDKRSTRQIMKDMRRAH